MRVVLYYANKVIRDTMLPNGGERSPVIPVTGHILKTSFPLWSLPSLHIVRLLRNICAKIYAFQPLVVYDRRILTYLVRRYHLCPPRDGGFSSSSNEISQTLGHIGTGNLVL